MMRATEIAFVGALVHSHPWLLPILQEHIDDNDGVLPHLFLADVERWAEARFQAHGMHDEHLGQVLLFLESEYRDGGPEVEELISVSFLELLPTPDEPVGGLRSLLGPRLQQQLEVIG